VKSVDDMIGSLVSTLKQSGAWNNTYLVFSSDNGYHMGEHKLTPGKLTAFDTDIGVPLIVIGPHIGAGRSVTPFGENFDLLPTFDQWAATKPSEGIDGRDMSPVLTATTPGTAPPGWPTGVLVEHHGPDVIGTDPDYPPPGSDNPTTYEALRVDGAVYVEYVDGEREYYNLATDPYELHNVYPSLPPSKVAALHAELARLENCRDSPTCSNIITPPGMKPSPSGEADQAALDRRQVVIAHNRWNGARPRSSDKLTHPGARAARTAGISAARVSPATVPKVWWRRTAAGHEQRVLRSLLAGGVHAGT
jgi:arylsulfatase A-like enzyme